MKEVATVFDCGGEPLVGLISVPSEASDTAVLIIVGGPQYRVGSHRQFVQMARHLAAHGVAAMRFDVRGMGDSLGSQRSFEEIEADIAAALDALQAQLPSVRKVALWGLCGGASAALLYWLTTRDARVRGMVLVNPWVRSEVTLAKTQVKHYYVRRLMQREFWVKLVSGRVAGRALRDLLHNLRLAVRPTPRTQADAAETTGDLQERMAIAWARFAGPKLVVLSGNDYTAKEFLETTQTHELWRGKLAQPGVTRLDLPEADHTFSQPPAQRQVEQATLAWVGTWAR